MGDALPAGPVTEFCAKLDELRVESGADVSLLARRLGLSRAQLYAILAGKVKRPPDWDHVVRPFVDICTGGDLGALTAWRQRHAILTGVWEELRRRDRLAAPTARNGPAFAVPAPAKPDGGAHPPVVPQELPPAVPQFTGRAQELETLTGLLDRLGQEGAGTVVISAIGGTAGVGKTALAVHWAHRVAGQFPDGQLYVNLRGYDPRQPMPAADALAGFLRSLGVSGQDIPPEEDGRGARYRSLLAGRRMLVVLDNAGSADQVRPLLPGTPGCAVLVTSRDALAGLVARDGAARLDLDVLPLDDAVALLLSLIGARAVAEPDAVTELAVKCCRLPLALRVAAELAISRLDASLAGLVGELADPRARLDLLQTGGDARTGVRNVFSWSYRHLDPATARIFRLVGLHPGPDLDPYAAAAIADATVPQARRALDVLARKHLIQPAGRGRYGMHDLLRGYARELSASRDTADEQHASLTHLFDYYLHTATAAMRTLSPAEHQRRPRTIRPSTPVPPLADSAAARAWLDAERSALVASASHAAGQDWPGHATQLAVTLASYFHDGGHFSEAVVILGQARGAARRTGDRSAEAMMLYQLGQVDWDLSRFQQAAARYWQALTLFRMAGDRVGEARALGGIGLAVGRLGRYEQAARHQQDAVAIYCDIGDRLGQARALSNLGFARRLQGRYREAAGHFRQSLDLARAIGDHRSEAWALARLGSVDLQQGRHHPAAAYYEQAVGLFHEIRDTVSEFESLIRLGDVYLRLGRHEQAAANFEQSLAMSREIGDRAMQADALNGLGDVFLKTDVGQARGHYAAALRYASETGAPRQQARAHAGLAAVCQSEGDRLRATHHRQEALARYDSIGAPEADELRVHLATAGDAHSDGHKPTHLGCKEQCSVARTFYQC